MPEFSISPQSVKKPGGSDGMDVGSVDDKVDNGVLHEEKVDNCICPVDDEDEEDMQEEGAPVKPLKSPSTPSRQEMLEHSLTHYPFRSWCPHCVKGKSKASKHSSTGGVKESEVPVVAFDYAFLSDRTGQVVDDEEATDHSASEADGGILKFLVGHDSKSKCCAAIPVPQKGINID